MWKHKLFPLRELQTSDGQTVEVISRYDTYWYVYAPTLDCCGYVNSNYLQ